MTDLTGYERSVLSWLDCEGTMRLVEIVAFVNPPPDSKRAWLGRRTVNEWHVRAELVCAAVNALVEEGWAQCIRRRRVLRMSSVYGITEAGRAAFAAVNEMAKERS